jgi:type II secretory pathway component PulK
MVVPLMVVVFAGVAGCAFLAYSLISRGLLEGRASWVALGGLAGAVWILAMVVALRRPSLTGGAGRRPRSAGPRSPDPGPGSPR